MKFSHERLARDEADCVAQMLDGLKMIASRARQMAMEYQPDKNKQWLDLARMIDGAEKIMTAAAMERVQEGKGPIPRNAPRIIRPEE